MLYINRNTAYRQACNAVQRGFAWSFRLTFTKRRDPDTRMIEAGWEAKLYGPDGRFVRLA